MRKVLLRIIFDQFWAFQSVNNELLVGAGWAIVLVLVVALISLFLLWRKSGHVKEVMSSLAFWCVPPVALLLIPQLAPSLASNGIPVFGYGFMMFVGFAGGTLLAASHARRVGLNPEIIWDLMMWLLIPGIMGARLFYVTQYASRVFGEAETAAEYIRALFSLWDGGLVFYGSVIGGALGGLAFCLRRRIRPLQLADVVAPSLFVGLGFGRIGCFLFGCCWGGACDLPWAVQFPPGSAVYGAQLKAGVIPPGAATTTLLHPTQLYSSGLGFLLAGILIWFFRRRPYEGFVLGLMFTLYPINRFILEWIRADEKGQLGTSLTISQLISIGMFLSGIVLLVKLSRQQQQRVATGDSAATAPTAPPTQV